MMPHDEHAPIREGRDEYALLERAVRELLLEKGVIAQDRFRRKLDTIESATPSLGARLVARAWCDESFKTLLISDPKAAARECLGIELPEHPEICVLEDTPDTHHVIVCTLCSCYPKALLGLPPDWYKSFAYRSRMVIEPRAVLAAFGTIVPENIELRVVDSTADLRYLVLPMRPTATDGWAEEELLSIVTRDCMIGVIFPQAESRP